MGRRRLGSGHYDIAAVNEDLAALVAYWNKPPRKAKARK